MSIHAKNKNHLSPYGSHRKHYKPLSRKDLEEKIVSKYKKKGVNLKIIDSYKFGNIFSFKVKIRGKKSPQKFLELAESVRYSFKRPFTRFYALKNWEGLFLVVSETSDMQVNILDIFQSNSFQQAEEEMVIPIVIGQDIQGRIIIQDLAKLLHILVGGTTGSGKTVFLQCLITSILESRTPDEVNLLLFDTGSNDLSVFEGSCHLSHPVIKDHQTATQVILSLQNEMDRRYHEMEDYPYLVCVVDEASSFISNFEDKKTQYRVRCALSDLLRRGRKAKIIWILAAQDPTKEALPIERASMPTRISFRCAKSQNSVTILNEAGAEDLEGCGEMLFKCQDIPTPIRLQGAYVSSEDIAKMVAFYSEIDLDSTRKFMIPERNLSSFDDMDTEVQPSLKQKSEKDKNRNEELCRIILWTLAQKQISAVKIMKEFNIGNRTNEIIQKLEEFGIISELVSKKSRDVLCKKPEDLSDDAVNFLTENGVSLTEFEKSFSQKSVPEEVDHE